MRTLALLAVILLSACTSITIIRVENGTKAGQPGSKLEPQVLPPCKALNSEERGACVLTANQCAYGIAVVRAERKMRNTEVTLQCFVPNATDNGDGDGDVDDTGL